MASPAQQLLTLLPLLLGLAAAAAAAGADDDDCNRAGRCVGQIIATEDNILSAQQCLTRCKRAESCSWYNYDSVTRKCEHLSSCFRFVEIEATNYISGRKACSVTGPVSPYLLGHEEFTVVDVLNPDADFDCKIPPFPLKIEYTGVATFLPDPDRVLVCGGTFGDIEYKECFVLRDANWEVSDLGLPSDIVIKDGTHGILALRNKYWLYSTYYSYSFIKVPDLVDWLNGPNPWNVVACLIQLDDTHTLNVGGGGGHGHDAFVYDWETDSRTDTSKMKGEHIHPNCVSDGNGGGWVLGGYSPTLEHYNYGNDKWTEMEEGMSDFQAGFESHFFLTSEKDPIFVPLGEENENYYIYHVSSNEWSKHLLNVETNEEFLGLPIPANSNLLNSCALVN